MEEDLAVNPPAIFSGAEGTGCAPWPSAHPHNPAQIKIQQRMIRTDFFFISPPSLSSLPPYNFSQEFIILPQEMSKSIQRLHFF
jgi:hypothetical protein